MVNHRSSRLEFDNPTNTEEIKASVNAQGYQNSKFTRPRRIPNKIAVQTVKRRPAKVVVAIKGYF